MSTTYGFFVDYELKDATFKYGFNNLGIFAAQDIKKGQAIFRDDPAICNYLQFHEAHKAVTRDELLALCEQYPANKDFIIHYCYMVDDDAFDFPNTFKEKTVTENCMYFNHCCDSNCGFAQEDCGLVIAKRDISAGEELTYDYQCMDVEPSFYTGINCKCGSHKCRGVLSFDHYRHADWISENYKYASHVVQKHIDELKTKWFSARCYLKKYNNKTELGLTALKKIVRDELVAKFSDPKNISASTHYLRHSTDATCYVNQDGEVYAKHDIEPSTELTLTF